MTAKSFLLDSHIIIWWLNNDSRLPQKWRQVIANPDNFCYVSLATLWEITIKESLGKLSPPKNLISLIQREGFAWLNITIDHIQQLRQLPHIHKDPFDRLLAAQCLVENLTLITIDKNLLQYPIKNLTVESHP